jgi:hypothetical protein
MESVVGNLASPTFHMWFSMNFDNGIWRCGGVRRVYWKSISGNNGNPRVISISDFQILLISIGTPSSGLQRNYNPKKKKETL